MQYQGSKKRLSNSIVPIIEKYRKTNQLYIEPFCGGCNIIDKISGPRIASDNHEYLIQMWIELQKGWIPPEDISKEQYYHVKNNQTLYSKAYIGYVGFMCSFGAKWWGGYASNSKGDNYAARASRVLVKQIMDLKDVEFMCMDYKSFETGFSDAFFYCDIPYKNTTQYSGSKFDHDEFYEWCRRMKSQGHTILVSEYEMPSDFECVQEINHFTQLNKNKKESRVEKLFIL